jgi:hypothetical protein
MNNNLDSDSFKEIPSVSNNILLGLFFQFIYTTLFIIYIDFNNIYVLLSILSGIIGSKYQKIYFIYIYMTMSIFSNFYKYYLLSDNYSQFITVIYGMDLFLTDYYLVKINQLKNSINHFRLKHTIVVYDETHNV